MKQFILDPYITNRCIGAKQHAKNLTRSGIVNLEGAPVPLFDVSAEGNAPVRPQNERVQAGVIAVSLAALKKTLTISDYHDVDGVWLSLHANRNSAILMVENFFARRPQ